MRKITAVLLTMAMVVLTLGSAIGTAFAQESEPQPAGGALTCVSFEETDHEVCDEFLAFWMAHGGLMVFGYPLTDAVMEVNPDTGQSYLTQYFERERFELHPENAGTVYEVLLGRLGAQLLAMEGRDWMSFPVASPTAPHYFVETGHAVDEVFWPYFSTHGLELGDKGMSVRESIALFGYPISPAVLETNSSGDTVVTQWFERARFEYHPDNPAEFQVLLGRLGAELLAFDELEPSLSTIATGLDSPRGLAIGPNGAVYVTEAGRGGDECVEVPEPPAFGDPQLCFGRTGALTRVANGEQQRIVSGLPSHVTGGQVTGVQDVAVAADGEVFLTFGYAQDPAYREQLSDIASLMGQLVSVDDNGQLMPVADLAAHELVENPEELGGDHSNPYGLIIHDGTFVVADSAGNDLLRAEADGTVSTLAIFPPQMVAPPPGTDLPPETLIPMASVPTSVTVGPDGAYYVGEFTGYPFTPGAARIWRVVPGEAPEVYATGFTAVIDLAFDSAGRLYVLEAVTGGLLAVDPANPESLAGSLIRVDVDGTRTEVVSDGLVFPTSLLIAPDGRIFVTNYGVVPGKGTLEMIDLTT